MNVNTCLKMAYNNLYKFNSYQTSLEDLNIESENKDVKESFFTFLTSVPYIKEFVKADRLKAKDLPRDSEGKIVVDLTKPHILENMDWFRQTGLHFKKFGRFTDLRPNGNPNSEYGRWVREEVRRCHEGLVRPSDGEWIPGDLYFFWNYNIISMNVEDEKAKKGGKKKKGNRVLSLPDVWDGHYYKFHYLNQARENGKHCLELASRQKGKTICAASMLAKRFILGESSEVKEKVNCFVTAQEKKYIVQGSDMTLDKFQFLIDFLADNTEWPHRRLSNSLQNMQWTMGYEDNDTKTRKGTLNSVTGITAKDDESKLRGTRGVLYIIEEGGSFPRLIQLWNNMLPSVQDGNIVYGTLYSYGTSGDSQSDFYAMSEMMYHPDGYDIYGVPNVYDLEGKGGKKFGYFFPGYLNYSGYYDKNGNSDVTKALLDIVKKRWEKKRETSDITAVTKLTAEIPVVPQEAIIKTRNSFFPIILINERISQLEQNFHEYDDSYVGTLVMQPSGEVTFKPTEDSVIMQFPLRDNKVEGALQIFNMPEKIDGKVQSNRYVIGHDPVNQDEANSMSLSSTFVVDLYTESIVAEYTGRKPFQEESFELLRLLGLFYNAPILYESNNKMCYAYFSKMNCTYMLADTPEYLRERDIVKSTGYGNSQKGVPATVMLNNHEDELLRDWLLMPKTKIEVDENGEEHETTIPNVMTIRNLALLKELSRYEPGLNVDRVRALGITMIMRNQIVVNYGGDFSKDDSYYESSTDDFFKRNGFIHD